MRETIQHLSRGESKSVMPKQPKKKMPLGTPHSMTPIVIGSSLFWSWGFLCYLSPVLFPPDASLASSIGIEYGFFASQASAFLFALIVSFISHWRKLVIKRVTFFLAAFFMSLSVLVLAWAIQQGNIFLMIICGLLDGICVPILGVAWGTRYSLHSKSILPIVVLSFLVGYLLFYLVSALPHLLAVGIVALFPLISWAFWVYDARLRHEASSEVFATKASEDNPGTPGEFLAGTWETAVLPWKSIAIFLAAAFIGNLIVSFILGQGYAGVEILYNGGVLVCALLATMTLSILAARKNAPPVSDFYKITLAFSVVGLVAILVFGAQGVPLGGAFVQGSGMFLQVLIILVVTQSTQETGISPLLSFSVGQGVIAAVVFFANVLGKVLFSVFGVDEMALNLLCGCGILALFFMLSIRAEKPETTTEAPSLKNQTESPLLKNEEIQTEESLAERTRHLASQFGLTKREEEILEYLARGRSLPYISDILFVTTGTVKTHTMNIYRKTEVNSRQELLDLIESVPLT